MQFTEKQLEVLETLIIDNPRVAVTAGAKRAGKTFVLNFAFLEKVRRFKNKNFIIGGVSYYSIWRNILNDWEMILNKKIKLHKDGHFKLFGNRIYIFNGSNSASWKSARGFTAQGALLNEATALHERFVKEVISRCSEANAFVYMDTNPENPQHFVKLDYFDKNGDRLSDGSLNVASWTFTLDDNTALDKNYIESIKKITPKGFYYDRDILGLWKNSEGLIYQNYDFGDVKDPNPDVKFKAKFVGVDWGYGTGHPGVLLTCGLDTDNNFWVLEEVSKENRQIEWWLQQARNINSNHGNLNYFADSARIEHIDKFRANHFSMHLAKKNVNAGIELVNLLMENHKVFISPSCKTLIKELGLYEWGLDGKPVKKNDNSLDALRYAIYSFYRYYPRLCSFINKLQLGGSDEDME